MRYRILTPACFLLLVACSPIRADHAGPDCCSTYPIYLCQPGFLGYPLPPRPLATYEGCGSCGRGCCDTAYGCGRITPNPYSCCFYGVTLSNYGLITPLGKVSAVAPSQLPALPPVPAPPEKLPAPEAR